MRIVLGLMLLAGCNRLYGLEDVVLTDASPDVLPADAAWPTVNLVAITPDLDAAGQPTGEAAYMPFVPAPVVQYGEIGGDLTPTSYDAIGNVAIPPAFSGRETPWRLVYQYADQTPHEVQWNPRAGDGFFTDLQMTPFDRPEVPPTAALDMDPEGTQGSFVMPRVYTTNAWTETRFSGTVTAPSVVVSIGLPSTRALAGVKRAPSTTDRVVLATYGFPNQGCYTAAKGIAMTFDVKPGLNAPTSVGIIFHDSNDGWKVKPARDTSYEVLTSSDLPYTTTGTAEYRVMSQSPSARLPMLRQLDADLLLPVPVGLMLGYCDVRNLPAGYEADLMPTFASPRLVKLGMIGTYQVGLRRQLAEGPVVMNGQAAAVLTPQGSKTPSPFFDVQQPQDVMIDDILVPTPTTTGVPSPKFVLPFADRTAKLTFTITEPFLQAGTTFADVYEATLYEVSPTALTPVHEFTFNTKTLEFDTSLIEAGKNYTFAVRAVRGPGALAMTGNFRVWSTTQSTAVLYTQTFSR